jgi:anti-sigma B factor antagonist
LLTDNIEIIDKPEVKIIASRDSVQVCLSGSIDMDSSPALRPQLLAVIDSSNAKSVYLDFSAVSHIDSSGIATLIEALRIARSNRTELRLEGLHDRLRRVFEITGLLSLFNGSSRR